MSYTPIKYPTACLSNTDGELLRQDYEDAITAQAGTQVAKVLNFSAYIAFIIPGALEADYNAASQTKKESMCRIAFEAIASGQDFDTYYTTRYNALWP